MGLLDLRGELGRKFGGIGAALTSPSLLLEAEAGEGLQVSGEESERVGQAARAFFAHYRIDPGAHLRVHRMIPSHAGLGSGTQLALATGLALSRLFGIAATPEGLAAATARGRRSAIGTWAFDRGGFVLEGGRSEGSERPAPLLLHRPMPASWRCLLLIPDVPPGLSGEAEDEAFRTFEAPPASVVEKIAHQILMVVLPGLVEEDLPAFGRGITAVQALVGEMFERAQGGRFAHPLVGRLVEELLARGAAGAGQSSWGPAVFGLFPDEAAARKVQQALGGTVTPFDNAGARVGEGSPPESP
jgi:beta-RFAP synthase